jgi:hypothetical protein
MILRLCKTFHLAQDFYWHNPAKLPSPIEWVNKRKLRAKDSVNTVWWFGKTRWPKANVTKVLAEYSDRMKKLLEDPEGFYTPKKRPSGHDIGKAFAKDAALLGRGFLVGPQRILLYEAHVAGNGPVDERARQGGPEQGFRGRGGHGHPRPRRPGLEHGQHLRRARGVTEAVARDVGDEPARGQEGNPRRRTRSA